MRVHAAPYRSETYPVLQYEGSEAHARGAFAGSSGDGAICPTVAQLKVGLVIRGFLGRKTVFVQQMELEEDDLHQLLPHLAERHAEEMMDGRLSMIEIEFPDEPEDQRYFRIGVDPSAMVNPMKVMF